jgi:hypothetical protein
VTAPRLARTPPTDGARSVSPLAAVPDAEGDRRSELLRALFADRQAAALFIVLRNDEGLPTQLTGNDLDLAVTRSGTVAATVAQIRQRATELGWAAVCVSRRAHMTALSLVDMSAATPTEALHIDVFDGVRALGVPLLTAEELAAESAVTALGVRRLTDRGRALATLAHHLGNSGGLTKDKYLWELADALRRPADRAWLIASASRILGRGVGRALSDRTGRSELRRASAARLAAVRVHALRRAPGASLGAMAAYALGQLPSLVTPSGIVGRSGSPVAALGGAPWTAELACQIAPVSFVARTVRSGDARTLNSPKHQQYVTHVWRRWRVVRWLMPSVFLWVQAKRNRVVVLDQLPIALRALRRVQRPAWLLPEGA